MNTCNGGEFICARPALHFCTYKGTGSYYMNQVFWLCHPCFVKYEEAYISSGFVWKPIRFKSDFALAEVIRAL